jgi:cytochrome P450 / NADPH-cytochrome P450 reductase
MTSEGFVPHIVTLDSIETSVPTDGPVIVLTASYEGQPADTARRFVEMLSSAQPGNFANVRFTVFGCGHHDWVQTYQKIPRLIDQVLGDNGGQRLMDREEADSGADNFFDTVYLSHFVSSSEMYLLPLKFDNWLPKLWEMLGLVS